jgi:hypothetical protein
MRYRRQASKQNLIVNAENELNQWYLENLAKHTIRENEVLVFSSLEIKEIFQIQYQEKIQELLIKYGLHSNQLMRSGFDTNEIEVSNKKEEPIVEPIVEPEVEHIGITIEQVEIDCNEPSEETKESEPEINGYVKRIEELWEIIKEHELQIRICKDQISALEIYYN